MSVKEVTAAKVLEDILDKRPLFILDVRNEERYADWRIEGTTVDSINIPYYNLLDNIESYRDQLPADREILVVCAKEGSSKMVAEQLSEAGYRTAYLEGGMGAWSTYMYKKKFYQDEQIKVYQFMRVGKGCLSYMVISGKEALVIDPARFIDEYMELAEEEKVKITHIVDSHLHADHISGGPELAEATGATYYLMKSEGAVYEFEPLENHEHIRFEKVDVRVLAVKTPGHTPGSVSFFVNDKLLFSGDTIFVSGLGRPDLGNKVKEWAEDLYETISEKISTIADDVLVLPAHYGNLEEEMNDQGAIAAHLGEIRKNNPMMQGAEKEQFINEVSSQSLEAVKPPNFEEIVAINRGTLTKSEEELSELEIGPNRCAVHHTA